jgi:hypothetical protein
MHMEVQCVTCIKGSKELKCKMATLGCFFGDCKRVSFNITRGI